jgi:eukaryotic-like serine/threonine-protein kinase
VLSDSKVSATMQQMARPTGTRLTGDLIHDVCLRARSKAYIAGAIGSLGSKYVVELRAVECQSGKTFADQQVTAESKKEVLNSLGAAASKLRAELGESLASVQRFDVPLEVATTSSLDALKAYSLGLKAGDEQETAASLKLHERAIQLDPDFAMGYLAVGDCYTTLGEVGRASEYITKAFQLRDHASESERLAITGVYYFNVTGELDKAAKIFQQKIASYPNQFTDYNGLTIILSRQGQYREAADLAKKAIGIGSDDEGTYENLAGYNLALQDLNEARRISTTELKKTDDFILHLNLAALAFLESDNNLLAEQQKWLAAKPDYENYGLDFASESEAYIGHQGKARELNQRAIASAVKSDNKENAAIFEAIAAQREAAYGNTAEARKLAADATRLAPKSQGAQSEAALAFAFAGDARKAESLARDLNSAFPLDTQIQSIWLPTIKARLALNKKDASHSLDYVRAPSAIDSGEVAFVMNISCLYPNYVRGEAYLAAGQSTAAGAEFQKILDHSGIVWNCWTGALAHLGVARANALQAKTAEGADADAARVRALAAYEDFLTLWKDADPDIPIYKQAKTEYARLQ